MPLHLSFLRVDQLLSKVVVLLYPSVDSRWMFLCLFTSNPWHAWWCQFSKYSLQPSWCSATPHFPRDALECRFLRFCNANHVTSCLSSLSVLIPVFWDLLYKFLLVLLFSNFQSLVLHLYCLCFGEFTPLLIPKRRLF